MFRDVFRARINESMEPVGATGSSGVFTIFLLRYVGLADQLSKKWASYDEIMRYSISGSSGSTLITASWKGRSEGLSSCFGHLNQELCGYTFNVGLI